MRRTFTILLLAALPISFALGTSAVVAPAADRVEEDWQLVISTPDPSTNSPQITMTMKPGNDASYPNMIFNVNYQDYPSFISGGLQMKVWQGNQVAASSTQGSGQLQTNNETITWTQRMSLSGGNLNFKILSGNSTTWSTFWHGGHRPRRRHQRPGIAQLPRQLQSRFIRGEVGRNLRVRLRDLDDPAPGPVLPGLDAPFHRQQPSYCEHF